MIKTFRFALLACGLVVGALTATAAAGSRRSASPRLNWLLMLKNALSPGGSRRSAPSTFARAPKG